jgi:RNA polymerase sigma factor (sigma-70 family)
MKANLGLVRYALRPFRGLPVEDVADLWSIGLEGLWYAIRDYDMAKGEFGPYAVTRIHYLISRSLHHDRAKRRGAGVKPIQFSTIDHEDGTSFADTVEDPQSGYEERINAKITAESALASMGPLPAQIFRLRAHGYTLHELMPVVGVSYQRIQQIEAKTRKKMIIKYNGVER